MKYPRQSPSLLPWIIGLTILALAVWVLGEYVAAADEREAAGRAVVGVTIPSPPPVDESPPPPFIVGHPLQPGYPKGPMRTRVPGRGPRTVV